MTDKIVMMFAMIIMMVKMVILIILNKLRILSKNAILGTITWEKKGQRFGHIAPLARSVDLYDEICVFIAYKSTFIVDNKPTIYVANKSW